MHVDQSILGRIALRASWSQETSEPEATASNLQFLIIGKVEATTKVSWIERDRTRIHLIHEWDSGTRLRTALPGSPMYKLIATTPGQFQAAAKSQHPVVQGQLERDTSRERG